ncbi:hypothetical protein [Streptomyces sp. CB03238]
MRTAVRAFAAMDLACGEMLERLHRLTAELRRAAGRAGGEPSPEAAT